MGLNDFIVNSYSQYIMVIMLRYVYLVQRYINVKF